MKKQILFIVLFVLAIFTVNKSYAQDIDYITAPALVAPTTLECTTSDALHPLPGVSYPYTVDVDPDVLAAGGGYIQWFVYNASTNGGTLITDGSIAAAIDAAEPDGGLSQYLLDAEDGVYNSETNSNISPTINVSWQSFDGLTNQILLVAYVMGNGSCADNIEVFRIEPAFSFTLDIAGLMPDGTLPTGNAFECVTPVQSAVYDGTSLTMDYGDNYIYFTVNAANFVHSWTPTFSIVDNTTGTTVALTDIMWATPDQAILNAGGVATGTWNSATTPVPARAASGAVGAIGEGIVVRVHLDHGAIENDVAGSVIIGIDGVMYNVPTTDYTNTALRDLDPSAAGAPCTQTETDQATYDLTPRPNVTTAVIVGGFEPKLP